MPQLGASGDFTTDIWHGEERHRADTGKARGSHGMRPPAPFEASALLGGLACGQQDVVLLACCLFRAGERERKQDLRSGGASTDG